MKLFKSEQKRPQKFLSYEQLIVFKLFQTVSVSKWRVVFFNFHVLEWFDEHLILISKRYN